MDKIKEAYESTLRENLDEIRRIIKEQTGADRPDLMKQFEEALNASCTNITSRWLAGKKYVRTLFAKKAFAEYPEDITRISILIDAIINILDDILDEEMGKELKALYIVELIRVLSLFSYHDSDEKIRNAIGNYFNKIISVAIAESVYKNLMREESGANKLIEYSIQAYDFRSLDMDIFVELPIIRLYGGVEKNREVVKIARVFRVLNLIKKDMKDVEHDRKNQVETVVTLLLGKPGFRENIETLLEHYAEEAGEIKKRSSSEVVNKFCEMIENEKQEVKTNMEALL